MNRKTTPPPTRRLRLKALVAACLTLLGACGESNGSDSKTSAIRTIKIGMVDTAFEPAALKISRGESVRFVFTNTGTVTHDAFIGNVAAQAEHEAEMRNVGSADHSGGHGDVSEDALSVEPGDTGDLTHVFEDAGTIEIGCHQAGHYDAGMKITVEVV